MEMDSLAMVLQNELGSMASVIYTDIDECSGATNGCTQGPCTNTPGSYTCGCDPGYELDGDRFSCNGITE